MLSLLSLAAGAVSALPLQRHPAERSAVLELWDQGAALDSYTTADGRRFGRGLLPLFMLQQPGFTNLNHGSFGTMPHTVFAQQIAYIRTMESRPDDWFRGIYQALMDDGRKKIAKYINAQPSDLGYVMNASDGINALLNVCCREPEDYVLRFSFAYPMVKNTMSVLEQEKRCTVWTVPVALPCQAPEDVVTSLEQALAAHPERRVVLAVIDHIVSVPGIVLPLEELARVCKNHGVQRVMADAAHAIGQVPLNMERLHAAGVDYYVTNLHKWLYAPKGCAVLWARDPPHLSHGGPLRPLIVSAEYHNAKEHYQRFDYVGTRDYTAYCAAGDAVDFRLSLGDEETFRYMHGLGQWASLYIATLWRTSCVAPLSMTACLINIRLPTRDEAAANGLYEYMARKKNTSVVVYPLPNGTFWMRLSAQVYVSREDFRQCALDVLDYLSERKALEWEI